MTEDNKHDETSLPPKKPKKAKYNILKDSKLNKADKILAFIFVISCIFAPFLAILPAVLIIYIRKKKTYPEYRSYIIKKMAWVSLFALIAFHLLPNLMEASKPVAFKEIPECNNEYVVQNVKRIQFNIPFSGNAAKISNLQNIKPNYRGLLKDRSGNSVGRVCDAIAQTNMGTQNIQYVISWADRKAGTLYFEAEIR